MDRDYVSQRTQNTKESLREMWNTIKHSNMCIMGVPTGDESEKEAEKIFKEIMAKNSQIYWKTINYTSRKFNKL